MSRSWLAQVFSHWLRYGFHLQDCALFSPGAMHRDLYRSGTCRCTGARSRPSSTCTRRTSAERFRRHHHAAQARALTWTVSHMLSASAEHVALPSSQCYLQSCLHSRVFVSKLKRKLDRFADGGRQVPRRHALDRGGVPHAVPCRRLDVAYCTQRAGSYGCGCSSWRTTGRQRRPRTWVGCLEDRSQYMVVGCVMPLKNGERTMQRDSPDGAQAAVVRRLHCRCSGS
jgi:hypothetical protein